METAHIGSDLRDDHLSPHLPDRWDRSQPVPNLRERGHHLVDLRIEAGDGSTQMIDVAEVLGEHLGVVLAKTARG
jgi:hypothetical protein